MFKHWNKKLKLTVQTCKKPKLTAQENFKPKVKLHKEKYFKH
jgi:hypothetical protein